MSGIAGSPPPDDDAARDSDAPGTGDDAAAPAPPPYPGWSPQQPETRGWTAAPGSGGPGPSAPSGGAAAPGGANPPGGQPPAGGWGPATGWDQPPGQQGGWDRPGGPTYSGPPQGGPGGAPGYGAWGAGTGPAWQAPDVKPGVIPLRPLGVTEILDGAITTIRRNLAAMLGLSAIVAAGTQILSSAVLAWIFGEAITEPDLGMSDAEALESLARGIPAAILGWLVTLIATVFLTGVLTVVVGQAVLGRDLSIGQAWRESKGRLLRLLGLTLTYTLIWFSPALVVLALALLLGLTGGSTAAAVLVGVGALAAIPITAWLYVRYALSTPALMLETTSGDGAARPIRIFESLRRSATLVRTSWWRVFAILLLIFIIVVLIGQVVAVPFGVPTMLGTNATDEPITWYVLNTLAGMISATITAPFSAAATALLYIDRRIRREGLDIELARAAGVELHGRGGPGAPPGTP
jgi:hypothetical protein